MITLLCYWWILLWNIEVKKEVFAGMSTFEIAIELTLFFAFLLAIWSNRK